MSVSAVAKLFAWSLLRRMQGEGPSSGLGANDQDILLSCFERLWQTTLDGDACLALGAHEQEVLARPSCNALIAPDMPLMVEAGMLYLSRFWHAERRLAQALVARLGRAGISRSGGMPVDEWLNRDVVAAGLVADLHPAQKAAVATALSGRLTVVFGGPGTGKTRTMASVIACHALRFGRPVWVAAPTARAGARLMESLQVALAGFSPEGPVRACLPKEALTIQRVLSRLPDPDQIVRYDGEDNEQMRLSGLPGLLIVDEASMLSLELCDLLLAALDSSCDLVLVGDPMQLNSVETGAVFSALCESVHPDLVRARVRLSRNFRQTDQGALGRLAESVQAGVLSQDLFGVEASLHTQDVRQIVEQAARLYQAQLELVHSQTGASPDHGQRARVHLKLAKNYRLLSARRSGYAGADQLSEAVLTRLRQGMPAGRSHWFEGRMITVIRNDPGTGLFNGDTGVFVRSPLAQVPEGGWIAFERPDELLLIPPSALPEHQNAYCLSVHQSQGSEFDMVDFVAAPAEHVLATRELLYTAVTRARQKLRVYARFKDLAWAAAHATQRVGRLRERLDLGPVSESGA